MALTGKTLTILGRLREAFDNLLESTSEEDETIVFTTKTNNAGIITGLTVTEKTEDDNASEDGEVIQLFDFSNYYIL